MFLDFSCLKHNLRKLGEGNWTPVVTSQLLIWMNQELEMYHKIYLCYSVIYKLGSQPMILFLDSFIVRVFNKKFFLESKERPSKSPRAQKTKK